MVIRYRTWFRCSRAHYINPRSLRPWQQTSHDAQKKNRCGPRYGSRTKTPAGSHAGFGTGRAQWKERSNECAHTSSEAWPGPYGAIAQRFSIGGRTKAEPTEERGEPGIPLPAILMHWETYSSTQSSTLLSDSEETARFGPYTPPPITAAQYPCHTTTYLRGCNSTPQAL